MYTLNISRQLITFCAKLQIYNPRPKLSKRCPIALAADAKGLFEATACKKHLAWKEHPDSTHWMAAEYSSTITDWMSRFDRYHKYPAMLFEHVLPVVIRIAKLPKRTGSIATHIVMTRSKLNKEYIQRTPKMCRKAISFSCYDKILGQDTQIDRAKVNLGYPKRQQIYTESLRNFG